MINKMIKSLQANKLKQKKGLGVLSDLMWIFAFVIAMLIMYLIFFKPLIEKHYEHKIIDEGLANHAQYVTFGLMNRQASAGLNDASPGLFRDAVAQVGDKKKELQSGEFDDYLENSPYVVSFESMFAQDKDFWKVENSPVIVHGVAIALYEGNTYLKNSCKYHTNPASQTISFTLKTNLCIDLSDQSFISQNQNINIKNELPIKVRKLYYDYGTAHVPSSSGVITVYLMFLVEDSR